jgi:hypothetical protein
LAQAQEDATGHAEEPPPEPVKKVDFVFVVSDDVVIFWLRRSASLVPNQPWPMKANKKPPTPWLPRRRDNARRTRRVPRFDDVCR